MEHDVAIIGCGRIGLPLALAFADRGLRTIGIEIDPDRLDAVRSGRMPFDEPGAPEVLSRVTAAGTISWSHRVADAAQAAVGEGEGERKADAAEPDDGHIGGHVHESGRGTRRSG